MIKCGQSETKALYGSQCRNHYQAGSKLDLVTLDHQRARRRDLVYRFGRVELFAAHSLREWPRSTRSDGGGLGYID